MNKFCINDFKKFNRLKYSLSHSCLWNGPSYIIPYMTLIFDNNIDKINVRLIFNKLIILFLLVLLKTINKKKQKKIRNGALKKSELIPNKIITT